jgi:hypothetical protein
VSKNKIGNVRYYVTLRLVRATSVAVEKVLSITYSESVFVALGMQRAMLMSHIATCGMPSPTIF